MKLLLVADSHYYIDKKGDTYVESVFDYSFFSRYLDTFDSVWAIVRAEKVDTAPTKCKLASGDNVHFLTIPPTRGIKEYIKSYTKTKRLVKKYIADFDCAIFRIPGVVANLVCKQYMKTGKKYAVEVVVDPWENFSKGTMKSPLRPIIRRDWTDFVKKACMDAIGVSYVTERYLQEKYPCKAMQNETGYFTASYSSVELPDNSFGEFKSYTCKDEYVISHVANSFSGYGKGHMTLIRTIKRLKEKGYDNISINFIGDGPKLSEFKEYAQSLGIGDSVHFLGRLPNGAEVRKRIAESDMFVFPTRAEGLPRVILEAMAEGLPVVASPVCGIPEIIDSEYLVEYDDIDGYADAIIRFIEHPDLMTEISKRNIAVAKRYSSSILQEKRRNFYNELKNQVDQM